MRNAILSFITGIFIFLFASSLLSMTIYAQSGISSSPKGSVSADCQGLGFIQYIICYFSEKPPKPTSSQSFPQDLKTVPPVEEDRLTESLLQCTFYSTHTECQSSDLIKPTKPQENPLPDEPFPLQCYNVSENIYECTSLAEVPLRSISPSPALNRDGCVRGGCSGQLCEDEGGERLATTCEWKEEYSCYQQAVCERQSNGIRGFTQTDQLQMCLQKTQASQ